MRVKSVTRQSGTMKQKGSRTRQCAVYARALRIASFLFARSSLFPAGHRAANSPLPCSALPPPPSLSSLPTSSPYPRRDHQKKRRKREKQQRKAQIYIHITYTSHHHHHRRRLDPCAPTVTRPTLFLRPSQISPPATEREERDAGTATDIRSSQVCVCVRTRMVAECPRQSADLVPGKCRPLC